ncbi:MFS general substrate transporter [Ascodesmis nigricans]|uniref:MFS general substrate transporter n=1 Tax=Ascodesmis nigricans TaxID=341454 RepID=A0A4S2MHL8_9PEZI|nr:MFS general substrate transporter [Ascodesmis nigricans]
MADVVDLERVLSRMSGFDPEIEMKKVRTLHDVEEGRGPEPSGVTSPNGTLTPSAEDEKQDAWARRPGQKDPNAVYWDGPDDPENPMNWPQWKKNVAIGIASSITFVTPLASSMFAPGVPQVMHEFKSTNTELASFVVSVYILGFAVGPLFLSPASELWGRNILYNVTNVCFCLCTVGCALAPNLNFLIGFRFLAGCFGAAPLTIGGGTITDVTTADQRGVAMALFSAGPLLGPVVGPIIGGFLTQAKGWRWVFWLLVILSGFMSAMTFLFLRETYAPTLLAARARKLRKSTGNQQLRSALASDLPAFTIFKQAIIRPLQLLFTSPIVFFLSLYTAVNYGYLFLLFTTFPTVFQNIYGFTTGTVGLAYLGLGLGSLLGLFAMGLISDRLLVRLTAKAGVRKPEFRLPPMIYGSALIPIGLFWYGWTAENHVQYMAPIIGTSFVGIGLLTTFMPVLTYLVDAFEAYSASALAAATVLRCVFGATLPIAGPKMYDQLGLGWGNSLLAFIAIALMPVPWVFNRYGE